MKKNVINELNTFLEGNYIAIHAYENYIHHINDPDLKQILQKIQQDHKQHAMIIAERIQNLGGVPVDNAGMKGIMAELANKLKGPTKDTKSILQDALVGENRGIEVSKKLIEGDLDPESLKIVLDILNHDQKHVELLNNLLQ